MSELPLRRDADDSPDVAHTDTDADPVGAEAFDPTDGVDESRNAYAASVVPYDDAPDECTIFPVDAAEADLVTTWISAAEGSFVALDEMR
jgi:hypothetical protein